MWRLLGVLMLVGLATPRAVARDSSSTVSASTTFGLGRGSIARHANNMILPETSWLVSGGIWWSDYAISTRYAKVGMDSGISELALVLERVLARRKWLVSVGVGPGLVARRHGNVTGGPGDDSFDRLGFAWQTSLQSGARDVAGVGFVVFGDIAGSRSCGGVAVVGRLGRIGRR